MKTTHVIVLMLAFLSVGCVHTQRVGDYSLTFAVLNEKLKNKKATVKLTNGQMLIANYLKVAADSTSWAVFDSTYAQNVATSQIVSIEIINRGKGAAEGLGIGLLSGAVVGGVIGGTGGDDVCDPGPLGCFSFAYTAGEKAAMGAAALGAGGLLLGTMMGASLGSKDRYILNPPNTPAQPSDENQTGKDSTIVARQPSLK